jgi:hypothetical protein
MEKRRIILTHWNAGVFSASALPNLLPELAVYALLYDQVLIREEDFFTNRLITSLLSETENFQFFEELLVSGLVRILRLPVSDYPAGRRFDPVRLPISARVEEHQLRRTYKGGPWKPTRKEWSLFEKLDRILYENRSAWEFHRGFPSGNAFAAELAEVLEHRESYGLSSHPLFRKIDSKTADAFISFCHEPGAWQRFLRDQGVTSLILGPDGGFFRSAAYQCSKLLPSPRRVQRLIESAYAATYCNREHAEGRYGGELVELPYRFSTADERKNAGEMLIRVEAAPTGATAKIAVMPGLAGVLVRTRESPEYAELRRVLTRLGTEEAAPLEAEFKSAWLNVCDVYADNWAYMVSRSRARSGSSLTYAVWTYLLARVLGFIMIPHGPFGLEGAVVVDHAVEHYGPHLLQSFRAICQVPNSRQHLSNAAEIRTSRVVPNTTEGRIGAVERSGAPNSTPSAGVCDAAEG